MPRHVNDTIKAFGYPETLIADLDHWVILLRPKQVTLGSLVLAAADPATTFASLAPETHAALGGAIKQAEALLRDELRCDKVNYLMLMMVDPHVHFHVLPRYGQAPSFGGRGHPDMAWPGPPVLSNNLELPAAEFTQLRDRLRKAVV